MNATLIMRRLDDPGFLGAEAKRMAEDLMNAEWTGPRDGIDACAHRVQVLYGCPASIVKERYQREPRNMTVSRWFQLFIAHQRMEQNRARRQADHRYAKDRQAAVAEDVHPLLLWVADLVAGADDPPAAR